MAAVTIAAEPGELLDRAAAAFRTWQATLAEVLAEGGLTESEAHARAATLLAACEGAVAISRATRNIDNFDVVTQAVLSDIEGSHPR